MSDAVADTPKPTDQSAADADRNAPDPALPDPALPDPAERGRLDISRTVLRKIAEHAADTVAGSARVRRRVAGVGLREHGASARLSGPERELRVRLDLALRYPVPVSETVRSVRDHVDSELGRIADCQVRSVDVTVSALVTDRQPPRVE